MSPKPRKLESFYAYLTHKIPLTWEKQLLTLSICLFILTIVSEVAMARAGGGGGFGRGGGGGFRGGSGNGDGGLFMLIYLALRYPYIGLPLVAFFIVFAYLGSQQTRSAYVGRTIRKAYDAQDQNTLNQATQALSARDPSFSPDSFAERMKQVFIKIQDAWSAQNMSSVRHLVSDGVFERFTLQFEIQKASLIRNQMDNLNIIGAQVVDIKSDEFFDAVHLRITASAKDYYIRTDKNKKISDGEIDEVFTEYWSFLRRPGAKALSEKGGLVEGFCPNCGTPLEINDTCVCPACQALINSGEYDWVLSEITQASEWGVRAQRMIPGFSELKQKDPAFNIQHIEDRVSVMFYRFMAARFFADSNYIRKLSDNTFLDEHQGKFTPLEDGTHAFYADTSVGAVELVEIELADESEDYDEARVKVRWSGHKTAAKVPSFMPPQYEESHIFTNEYILARRKDVASSTKNTLTSAHCPGCGAPETKSDSPTCEYCGLPLNDGSHNWTLRDIRAFSGYPQLEAPFEYARAASHIIDPAKMTLSDFDSESLMACAAGVMLADGEIDAKEQKLLSQMAQARGISQQKLDMIIKGIKSEGLHIPNPNTPQAAKEFLRSMVRMCLADGKVTKDERNLIKQLVPKMNYTDLDIDMMIKEERRNLYLQAKSSLKA